MPTQSANPGQRPRLTVRVGVTGARDLSKADLAAVGLSLAAALQAIRSEVEALATGDSFAAAYEIGENGAALADFCFLSPLAEGADRLAAQAAKARGYRLIAPLPFPQNDYEKDFASSVAEFRALLEGADVVELDGARDSEGLAERSYEAVGRFVARNSDVLIAIWDGRSNHGRGGTAEICEYAAAQQIPILWIDFAGAARVILDMPSFRGREKLPTLGPPFHPLAPTLAAIFAPPDLPPAERTGVFGGLARIGRLAIRPDPSPLQAFLAATKLSKSSGTNASDPYWSGLYRRADAIAISGQSRHRFGYLFISAQAFIGALLASSFGDYAFRALARANGSALIFGVTWNSEEFRAFAEFVVFVVVGALGIVAWFQLWHERWIAFRLLAELFRVEGALTPLALSPSLLRAIAPTADETGSSAPRARRESWISWCFLAFERGAPPPPRSSLAAKHEALARGNRLVNDQIAYHKKRRETKASLDKALDLWGDGFFMATGVLIVASLLTLWFAAPSTWVGLMHAAISVALAATTTLILFRTYEEYGLLALESERMLTFLADIRRELESIDASAALSSFDIGETLLRLGEAMLAENRGWAQLFKLRTIRGA